MTLGHLSMKEAQWQGSVNVLQEHAALRQAQRTWAHDRRRSITI
jgi:hypothetical protein